MEVKAKNDQGQGQSGPGNGGNGGGGNNGHLIHFKVDGEQYTTDNPSATPNFIIQHFGGQDPATNYLVRIQGNDRISYQDQGGEPIELHNGWRFQIVSLGPTPVSDGSMLTGVTRFLQELDQLGYTVETLPDKTDHVVFDYEIESGRFAGTKIRLGLIVPPDFPLSCPAGPMISPHIRPVIAEGQHPAGAIHLSQADPFRNALGGEWQYWSRPFRNWEASKKTVAAYLSHIWQLMDSQ